MSRNASKNYSSKKFPLGRLCRPEFVAASCTRQKRTNTNTIFHKKTQSTQINTLFILLKHLSNTYSPVQTSQHPLFMKISRYRRYSQLLFSQNGKVNIVPRKVFKKFKITIFILINTETKGKFYSDQCPIRILNDIAV